ncbi:hypothetical protein J437_LFUL004063 [Ladona fulva]|uniref:Uncharacterized protein n=1 Tax=Ladona fulva TaxID=123851 RepID=A0A8K0NVW2_LADFU|nr:hypothetical protein J437_LFUL004063 [Ladona fulva]
MRYTWIFPGDRAPYQIDHILENIYRLSIGKSGRDKKDGSSHLPLSLPSKNDLPLPQRAYKPTVIGREREGSLKIFTTGQDDVITLVAISRSGLAVSRILSMAGLFFSTDQIIREKEEKVNKNPFENYIKPNSTGVIMVTPLEEEDKTLI